MGDNHAVASGKLIIIMVGLPARGKSYITRKLARYLNWLQIKTRVFNVGEKRRAVDHQAITRTGAHVTHHSADFFDSSNKEAVARRDEIALTTLRELLSWLQKEPNSVAIFDATNSTVRRRRKIVHEVHESAGSMVEVLFLESCCFDKIILDRNMQLKLSGPDYKGADAALALADFRARVQMYEISYEALGTFEESAGLAYLTLIDVGRKLVAFNTNGFLTAQAMEYLTNFHLTERQIWLTRNGESHDDRAGRIGRHSPLSLTGQQYAHDLARFVTEQQLTLQQKHDASVLQPRQHKLKVWSSMMTQAVQTTHSFPSKEYVTSLSPLLNDLHAGSMTGLTFDEIMSRYPQEIAEREANPVSYRWPGPGGESHLDVIGRLRAMILELERARDDILLITHRAVMRVLLAYFQDLSKAELINIQVPLHRLYLVEPHPYGVNVKSYQYDGVSRQFHEVKGG